MFSKRTIIYFFLIIIILGAGMLTTIRGIMGNINLGLDLQGGFEVLYEVKPNTKDQKIDRKALEATVTALNNRINVLGVNEPIINIEGDNNIRVQLAGVSDQERARTLLSTEANLTFRDYADNILLSGVDLKENGAKVSFNQENQPQIDLKLKNPDKFAEVTRNISEIPYPNNIIVIWLDFEEGVDSYELEKTKETPRYASAASVNQEINNDTASISGNFTIEEAQELAGILNAGSLPTKLVEVFSTSVGATFGTKALDKTITAGIISLIAVFIFMIIFYRLTGFIASFAVGMYCYLMLLVFQLINGVLTLPGIAALILGIGVAVDANIISDERIKEELRKGRSVKSAIKAGHTHSLSTILDANITTLIVGIVLFIYGTSSVKGFATMLIISIFIGFITAVLGTRIMLSFWARSNFLDTRKNWLGVRHHEILRLQDVTDDLKIPTPFDRFDFVKQGKKVFIFSLSFIVIGIASLLMFGLNTSIDFSSGARVQVNSDTKINQEQLKNLLTDRGHDVEDIVFAGGDQKIAIVRIKGAIPQEEVLSLTEELLSKYNENPNISTVSPVVGKKLVKNALIATTISSLAILIYIALRFEWQMAIGAIVALLSDAFFSIVFFSLFRFNVDLTFIAAVLTIIGYSINDTIVTLDRLRENLNKIEVIRKKEQIAEIANISIRQTMTRSINTVITVILTVLAMLIFGSEAIFTFNLALLIGLITGLFSSVFIALPIWVYFKNREFDEKGSLKTKKEKQNLEGTV